MSGYIGNTPVPQATQTRDVFTATGGQTSFATSGYTPGYVDVWLNGVKLVDGSDFTASNGSDVVLTSGATAGDTLEVLSYSTYEVANQAFTGDFSVDGSTFKVDSVNNRVGIGTATPDVPFVLSGTNVRQKIVDGSNTLTLGQWDGLTNRIESSGRDMYLIQYGASNAIKFATNATERMVLDAAGRLTLPYQPVFFARLTSQWSHPSGTVELGGTWVADLNVGSNYNTTTRRFTAPVAGNYQFNTTVGTIGGVSGISYISSEIWVNGSRKYVGSWDSGGTSYNKSSASYVVALNANDYVTIASEINISVILQNSTHNTFSGYLIG